MRRSRTLLWAILYLLATIQFVWCYLWLVRPYVSTIAYEQGTERMPFQGRLLMMPVMQWAHRQDWIAHITSIMHANIYWFPRPMQPEALVQAVINAACVTITGFVAVRIYQAASRYGVMSPLIYPIVLTLCVGTYVLHTIQNFRFIYDLPSLAFFSVALWVIYFHKSRWIFAGVFLVATLNRETTLLLLPIYALTQAVSDGRMKWRKLWAPQTLAVVLPLAVVWSVWQFEVHRFFAANVSEFYPRIPQNFGFLLSPRAWPQMLGACCYLFPVIAISHKQLRDAQLRAWLWVLPCWFLFMFVYGILIETRIFGELIPYVACVSALIAEESIVGRLKSNVLVFSSGHTAFPQAAPAASLEDAA